MIKRQALSKVRDLEVTTKKVRQNEKPGTLGDGYKHFTFTIKGHHEKQRFTCTDLQIYEMLLPPGGTVFSEDLSAAIPLNTAYLSIEANALFPGRGINKEGTLKGKKKYFLITRILNPFM